MRPSRTATERAPAPIVGFGARDPYEIDALSTRFRDGTIHRHRRPDGMFGVASANHGFCNGCGEAFGSDQAFDMHMKSATSRGCIRPHETTPTKDGYQLVAVLNKYGTPIWRRVR